MEKNLPAMQETQVQSLGWEDPLEKGMAFPSGIPTPVFLPEESHGQRSLVSYSPWGLNSVRHDFAICCCSVSQLHSTLGDPVDSTTPGFPVLQHLLEFAQTYVHWVGDAIQPSLPQAWWLLLLHLLSRFSRVRLCATPETAAHHTPSSLGFSRQEHWSGLPFPSPMHESEKWKWSCLVVSNS